MPAKMIFISLYVLCQIQFYQAIYPLYHKHAIFSIHIHVIRRYIEQRREQAGYLEPPFRICAADDCNSRDRRALLLDEQTAIAVNDDVIPSNVVLGVHLLARIGKHDHDAHAFHSVDARNEGDDRLFKLASVVIKVDRCAFCPHFLALCAP